MTKRGEREAAPRCGGERRRILTLTSAPESSAAPAGLSWLNCALSLYCGHDTHSRRLLARLLHSPPSPPTSPLPPPALTKSQNPATAEQLEKANFLCYPSPTKKKNKGGGLGKKGGARALVLVSPRSTLKLSNAVSCRKRGGRAIILIPLPSYTPPCSLPNTCTFVCVPPSHPPDHRRLSAAAWQKSAGIDAVNGGNRVRCFNTVTLGGASQRNVTAMMSSQIGGEEKGGWVKKNIMQHYLPVQVGQDGVHSCLRPFSNNKKKNNSSSSRKHIRNLASK